MAYFRTHSESGQKPTKGLLHKAAEELWKTISSDKQKDYEHKYSAEKLRYQKELEEYNHLGL